MKVISEVLKDLLSCGLVQQNAYISGQVYILLMIITLRRRDNDATKSDFRVLFYND